MHQGTKLHMCSLQHLELVYAHQQVFFLRGGTNIKKQTNKQTFQQATQE